MITKNLLVGIFSVALVIAGCNSKTSSIPENVIERDSMVLIMADIHIAESRIVSTGYQPDFQNYKAAYMQHIISGAGIDTARFNSSFRFYASNPEIFHDLYEDVITEISRRQDRKKAVQQK